MDTCPVGGSDRQHRERAGLGASLKVADGQLDATSRRPTPPVRRGHANHSQRDVILACAFVARPNASSARWSNGVLVAGPSVNRAASASSRRSLARVGVGADDAARAAFATSSSSPWLPRRPAKIAAPSASRYVVARNPSSSDSSSCAAASSKVGSIVAASERKEDLSAEAARVRRAAARPEGHDSASGEDLARGVGRAGVELGLSRVQRTGAATGRVRRQLGRTFEKRGCGRDAAASFGLDQRNDRARRATASSGRVAAWARCQARRSGLTSGSVTSASARCTARRSRSGSQRDRRRIAPAGDGAVPGPRPR